VRYTAATGSLPLTPADQVELLFLLTRDQDEKISTTATESLDGLSTEELVAVLSAADTQEEVLGFFGARSAVDAVHQAVVRNQATSDETVCLMVPRLSETNLEFVVVNQTRLLRHPAIVVALEANENLNSDQRRRVNELKHDFKLGQEPEPAPEPTAAELPKLDLGKGPAEEEEPPPKSREEAQERYGVADVIDGELTPEEEEKRRSVFERIYSMTTSQKMMEALKGDREARMMLIRDRNRSVWSAVLSSPRMSEADAEQIVKMRNIAPEVLREVGKNRSWTKRYIVAHELVKNPKTPPEVSTKMLQRIKDPDLRRLVRDKNVPEQIRRMAQKRIRQTK
jgi:hypothetical protein